MSGNGRSNRPQRIKSLIQLADRLLVRKRSIIETNSQTVYLNPCREE
jgi:hypothetical protein